MEFEFRVSSVCRDEISVWDGTGIFHLQRHARTKITDIINRMGSASSKAQGLGAIITSSAKLMTNMHNAQRVYLIRDKKSSNKCNGLLKIGRKKLFVRNNNSARVIELNAHCVLDFYVHQSCQRQGVGKKLFDFMLNSEQLPASKFAIDRPSEKCLAFLKKHYGLSNFTPQNNNFVIFEEYFSENPTSARSATISAGIEKTSGRLSNSQVSSDFPQSSLSGRRSQVFRSVYKKNSSRATYESADKQRADGKIFHLPTTRSLHQSSVTPPPPKNTQIWHGKRHILRKKSNSGEISSVFEAGRRSAGSQSPLPPPPNPTKPHVYSLPEKINYSRARRKKAGGGYSSSIMGSGGVFRYNCGQRR
ncbi:hypothetical protein AAMO2058_001258300 [Amorphochlora amoebiformis]